MGTSPIVTDNMVILNCLGHLDDPRVLAINKADGSTIWKYSLHQENYSGDSYSTPVIYKNQVIIYGSKDVSGYDLNTGLRLWYFNIGVTDAVCTPVLGNGIIYTTAHSTYGNPDMRAQFPDFKEIIRKYDLNNDYKVNRPEVKDYQFLTYPEKPEISDTFTIADAFPTWDKNNDGFIDSLEWKVIDKYLASFFEKQGLKAIRLGGEGDISLSSFLWGNHDQVPHVSSPLFYNNHVYMIRDGGIISCFDSERGNILFREKLGSPGAYFASPVAADGRIYIASRNGIVTVIGAGDSLKKIATNDLGDLITATPALVDNKLYLRTARSLYAFGGK